MGGVRGGLGQRLPLGGRTGLGRPAGRVAAALAIAALCLPVDAAGYQRAKSKHAQPEAAGIPARRPEGPLRIVVSTGSQRLWVYDKAGLLETSTISTGVDDYPTPTGVFAIIDKEERHYSNIYGGASMPFMQRLTMSGVALHSGMVTGRPASHGCIRLPHQFAIRLFRLTGLGARVIIAPDEPAPAEISHPRLFVWKPTPPPPAGPAADQPAGIALAAVSDIEKGIVMARVGKITAARTAELEALPVSVFLSKDEGRVFVRHGFRPLFDAPAMIRDPERRLGTHIFTALEFKDNGPEMRWVAISPGAPHRSSPVKKAARGPLRGEPAPPPETGPPSSAAEALDRIELPQEALDRIAEMLTPGTTLIVSDHGLNRETRASGTDFVVLTK
jgi:L,D-transpeptidase-like protein